MTHRPLDNPLARLALAATLALLAAAIGCSDQPATEPPPPPGRTVAPAELAESAERAMIEQQFATAAARYRQAIAAAEAQPTPPADAADVQPAVDGANAEDAPASISPEQLQQWRQRSALAHWLAGEPEQAGRQLADDDPDAEPFRSAMRAYVASRLPGEPERMVDVLAMAPAMRAWQASRDALAEDEPVTAAAEPPPLVIQTQWAHLARLGELLAACAALDDGGLNLSRQQLVAVLCIETADPLAARARLLAELSPQEQSRLGLIYSPGPGELIIHSPPAPGHWAELVREWIVQLGGLSPKWGPLASDWRLVLAVRGDARSLRWWQVRPASPDGPAGEPLQVVFDRPAGSGATRLLAALNLLLSARPDGAVLIGEQAKAQRVASEVARRVARNAAAPVADSAGRWWVAPDASAGPAGEAIPLVAAWLTISQWPAEAGVAPAATEPDDETLIAPPRPVEP